MFSRMLRAFDRGGEEKMEVEELPPVKPSEMILKDYLNFAVRYRWSRHNQEENVAELIDHVLSNDPDLQLKACCSIRNLFFVDKLIYFEDAPNPPVKELIEADDFLSRLISFLNQRGLPQLRYEAVSILAIFSKRSECLALLVDHDIVPALAKLIHDPNAIRRKAFLTLGNIADMSQQLCHKVVLQHDVLRPLLDDFILYCTAEDLRIASMVLRQCCKTIPQMESKMVDRVLDVLQQNLQHRDIDIATNTAYTFASLPGQVLYQDSALDHTRIHDMLFRLLKDKSSRAVISAIAAMLNIASVSNDDQLRWEVKMNMLREACSKFRSICDDANHRARILETPEICAKLIDIIRHESHFVAIPVLMELAHIASGDEHQIQIIMDIGAMPQILRLLLSDHDGDDEVKSLALKVALRIAANGSPQQIQETVAYGILYILVDQFESLTTEIKEVVAGAILNVTLCGTPEVLKIVTGRCVKPMCDMLDCSDSAMIAKCLKGIDRMVKFAESDQGLGNVNGIISQSLKLLYGEYDHDVINGVLKVVLTLGKSSLICIQEIVGYGIPYALVDLFGRSETDIKQEVASAILDLLLLCPLELVRIVIGRCIKPLCEMLKGSNSKVILKFLKGLEEIAKFFVSERGLGDLDVAFYLEKIEEANGLRKISELRYNDDYRVSILAKSFLFTYWPDFTE